MISVSHNTSDGKLEVNPSHFVRMPSIQACIMYRKCFSCYVDAKTKRKIIITLVFPSKKYKKALDCSPESWHDNLWASLSSPNGLSNFGRGHYEEHFCEIILNLDQRFRK